MNKSERIDQLENLETVCHQIMIEQPERKAMTNDQIARSTGISVKNIDKSLRDGVVFYSSGWGWRLRLGWEDVLKERYKAEEAEAGR